jgi:hypothetical protein
LNEYFASNNTAHDPPIVDLLSPDDIFCVSTPILLRNRVECHPPKVGFRGVDWGKANVTVRIESGPTYHRKMCGITSGCIGSVVISFEGYV